MVPVVRMLVLMKALSLVARQYDAGVLCTSTSLKYRRVHRQQTRAAQETRATVLEVLSSGCQCLQTSCTNVKEPHLQVTQSHSTVNFGQRWHLRPSTDRGNPLGRYASGARAARPRPHSGSLAGSGCRCTGTGTRERPSWPWVTRHCRHAVGSRPCSASRKHSARLGV
jgi:hypothetical protein